MRVLMLAAMLFIAMTPALAAEGDVAGSSDPPGIEQRFEGATIIYYEQKTFDDYVMPTGKATARDQLASSQSYEGRVTEVRYEIPAGRSTLEVMRNYIDAFKAKGFETIFACTDKACGGRAFNYIAGEGSDFQETPNGQRYLSGKLGDLYASVFVVKKYGVGGPEKDYIYVRVVTVETGAMASELVTVDASQMEQAIDASGHVAVYGILFDTDSAKLLPDSRAAVAEVAKLLQANPELKLHVVGHTDSQGSLEHNMTLSRRRAQAVVDALTGKHAVDASRLLANGVASLAPVASNASEEGRAKNRRVELVGR